MSLHFIHPDELTPEVERRCGRLADAGIPLGSQTPLLLGVNDSVDVCRRLFHGLLRCRVKPYYLYQADLVVGTSHFRTRVSKSLEIVEGLRGHTSGYAVPTFAIDVPGGGGKIPVLPTRSSRVRATICCSGITKARCSASPIRSGNRAHRVHLRPPRRLSPAGV